MALIKKFLLSPLAVLGAGLLLTGCNVTTGTSGSSARVAALSGPQSAPSYQRLTDQDVRVPQDFEFIGQTRDMLIVHFGEPALVRPEGDAAILQFKTETPAGPCVLLAFVYEDRGDVARIRHLSVREGASRAAEPINCLRELALAYQNSKVS